MSSLSLLATFAESARLGSFAAAARELGLSPSAVAKNIARLEQQLGMRLFHRTTRRVMLTPEGEALFERCSRVLEELEALEAFAANASRTPSGTLRLEAPQVYGREVIMPLVAQLARAHPGINLDIRLSDQYADIVGSGIDAAIRVGEIRDSQLIARTFDSQQLGIFAAPAYLKARGTPQAIDDLAQHAIVGFRQPTSGRMRPWQLRRDGEDIELRPVARYLVSDGEGVVRAAIEGLGLIQVPGYMAQPALRSGELVEVLREHWPQPTPISIVYPSRQHVPLRLQRLIEMLLERESERMVTP
jgi:DNA-binding transcriptional LysR family regulator